MSHFLEFIAGFLLSNFGVPERAARLFVVLAMGIAGVCFLIFAVVSAARMDFLGIMGALFLAGLALLCFWLIWRGRHP